MTEESRQRSSKADERQEAPTNRSIIGPDIPIEDFRQQAEQAKKDQASGGTKLGAQERTDVEMQDKKEEDEEMKNTEAEWTKVKQKAKVKVKT